MGWQDRAGDRAEQPDQSCVWEETAHGDLHSIRSWGQGRNLTRVWCTGMETQSLANYTDSWEVNRLPAGSKPTKAAAEREGEELR